MKILVINDDRCHGSLLRSALKKVGHRAVVATSRGEAHRALANEPIDAAIIDIEMPEVSGIELAMELAESNPGLAIAFSAGSASPSALAQAKRLGKLLPKVWTIADVKVVIEDLVARVRAARLSTIASANPPVAVSTPRRNSHGSDPVPPVRQPFGSSRIPVVSEQDRALARSHMRARTIQGTDPPPAKPDRSSAGSRTPTRLSVSCKTWGQVRRLCDEHLRGSTTIAVRARHTLEASQRITIALALPSEMTLALDAKIVSVQMADDGLRNEYTVELLSLTGEYARRLLALCDANEIPSAEISGREGDISTDNSNLPRS